MIKENIIQLQWLPFYASFVTHKVKNLFVCVKKKLFFLLFDRQTADLVVLMTSKCLVLTRNSLVHNQ